MYSSAERLCSARNAPIFVAEPGPHLAGGRERYPIDNGACTAAAYHAVGAPPEITHPTQSTVTQFDATTSSGENISGEASTTSGGGLGSVAEGMQQAQIQQQQIEIERQYQEGLHTAYAGCMAERGWLWQPVAR